MTSTDNKYQHILNEYTKRPNAFLGKHISVKTWNESLDFPSKLLEFHYLSMHRHGIIEGMDVNIAQDGKDLTISEGFAVDAKGRPITISNKQLVSLSNRTPENGTWYVFIKYVETESGDTQRSREGDEKSLYMEGGYEIIVASEPPQDASCIELARIEVALNNNGAFPEFSDATEPLDPEINEIDLRDRQVAWHKGHGEITIGMLTDFTDSNVNLVTHKAGVISLVNEINNTTDYTARFKRVKTLSKDEIAGCHMLIIAGTNKDDYGSHFGTGLVTLKETLEDNKLGLVVVEICNGADDELFTNSFANAFMSTFTSEQVEDGKDDNENRLEYYGKIERALVLQLPEAESRGPIDKLLEGYHRFSRPPEDTAQNNGSDKFSRSNNAGNVLLLEGDYGCLWRGGDYTQTFGRGRIRDAMEFGINMAVFAYNRVKEKAL